MAEIQGVRRKGFIEEFDKETSVIVFELDSSAYVIIVSLATRNDTQIIGVDPTTGALCFSGRTNIDIFTSEVEAVRFIKTGHLLVKRIGQGKAVLGYTSIGGLGLLLIATKIKPTVPELPGGDCVYTVTESQWIKFPLRNPIQSKVEVKQASELTEITIDNLYFFCETRDITGHFPSTKSVENPDEEFVWNYWLSGPFRSLGLQSHCAVLLQGFAECRSFSDYRGKLVTVAIIARRSRLHPGTRYLARGLNPTFSTGNEVECEQIVWPSSGPSEQTLPFSTYLWRRGTVPIWWGAEIKTAYSEAEIYVAETDPYLGSEKYYKRLVNRYGPSIGASTSEVQGEKNLGTLIVCINLLRSAIGRPELVLYEHFQQSLYHLESRNEVPNAKLVVINYDWHEKMKLIGEHLTVSGLWEQLKDPTITIGFGMGEYYLNTGQVNQRDMMASKSDQGGVFKMLSKQGGVIRFNCADSLDRTNAASFFGAVQVLMEQCRRLDVPLDSIVPPNVQSGDKERDLLVGSFGPLPHGWEMKIDVATGKKYYLDHKTETTTWKHPCPDEPWQRFDMTVEQFRDATLPSPIAAAAELFLSAGDVHAMLYTGSRAMHSHIIQIFGEEVAKGMRSAAGNMAITLKRRYQNVMTDSARQKKLEMFLGYRSYKYFPTLPGTSLKVLTRPHAFLLNPLPSMFPVNDQGSCNFLLGNKIKDTIWVCPPSAKSVQLLIYLSEPGHVCQVLLTIAHGAADVTTPAAFDVKTGRNLGELKLVLEGATIPRCTNGTSLIYPIPGAMDRYPVPGAMDPSEVAFTGDEVGMSGDKGFPWLYEFEEQEGEIDFLTRLVAITFYPAAPGMAMTLGQVEVLGVSLLWNALGRTSGTFKRKKTAGLNCNASSDSLRQKNPVLSMNLLSLEPNTNETSVSGAKSTLSLASRSSNQVFDLLTGEFYVPVPSTTENNSLLPTIDKSSLSKNHNLSGHTLIKTDATSWNPFIDGFVHSNTSVSRQTSKSSEIPKLVLQENPVGKVYLDLLETLCGTSSTTSPSYQEAMELEIARLHLGLSAAERDKAFLSIGRDPATVDPNRLVQPADMVEVRLAALQLSALFDIDAEDKDLAQLGFDGKDPETVDDDDYHCLRTGCISSSCQVKYVENAHGIFEFFRASAKSSVSLICIVCRRTVCSACHAGKGSGLLFQNQNGPNFTSFGPSSTFKPARGPSAVDSVVCKICCPPFVRDAILLERVRARSSYRRQTRVEDACEAAMDGLVGIYPDGPINAPVKMGNSLRKGNSSSQISKGCEEWELSLAEFPYAGIISSVPTASGSEPLHSLLVSKNDSCTTSWSAPHGIETAELCIVLSAFSLVSSILLVARPGGYTYDNPLQVELWFSNMLTETTRTYLGHWDMKPDNTTAARSCQNFHYKLPVAVSCRILWIKLCLPSANRSSTNTVQAQPVMDLLSCDESWSSSQKQEALPSEALACIHLQRLLILGKHLPESAYKQEIDYKFHLECPPMFSRERVQVDSEHPEAGGRVVVMEVNQLSPVVAGFRLDAFAVLKNVAKYTSNSKKSLIDHVLGGSLEELITNLPSLRIRVHAVQETHQVVLVGHFSVPLAKSGCPFWFDFGDPIPAKLLIFELLGNISAMSNEEPSQDEWKKFPLPSGLSLMNKIRIYRYVQGPELGKWPGAI